MTGWRVFFIVAALFNFAAGVPLLVAPQAEIAMMGLPPVADVMYHQVSGILVICFGLGYGLVAGEPDRNEGIVWLGVLGKSGVIYLMAQAYHSGSIPFQVFSIALGDLAFVLGFIVFLFTRRRAGS